MKLFAVVDLKAKSIVATFNSINVEAAKRSFIALLTGPQNLYTVFPEDFALYPVCELSYDAGGLLVACQDNENLRAAGFNVDQFYVRENVVDGLSLGRDYLGYLRRQRLAAYTTGDSEDEKEDTADV